MVDSTLIESWASLKCLKMDGRPRKDGGEGSRMVDFKREQLVAGDSRCGRALAKTGEVSSHTWHVRDVPWFDAA